MGKVDIEEQSEILAESVFWDEDKYSFEDFMDNVRGVVKDVTKRHYATGSKNEIDDWDVFEQDLIVEYNKRFGEED